MKKTKIVCTIGPSSCDIKIMKRMVLAGMNVVRINLSHSDISGMSNIMKNVKQIRKDLGVPLPVMIDTRGPEIRVKTFKDGKAEIVKGQNFTFTGRVVEGNNNSVSLNIANLANNVKVGDKILACDGLLTFEVIKIQEKDIVTKALNSGVISNRKSLCIPGVHLTTPYLNTADKTDILWAIKNDVDYIAASFVNSKEDVLTLRKFIEKNGGDMKIVSKIESQCGVDNLDEIIKVSDALMVARGDLGVEISMEKLPQIQKLMIEKCVMSGKPVITATEMLESMINNNRPTRAEASDVANAVYDGTSCVMLSGETASGKFPVDAVHTMANILEETEKHIEYNRIDCNRITFDTISDVVSHSAVSATTMQSVKLICSFTKSGASVGKISRFRPNVPVIGATPSEKVYRQLDMLWGVKPILTRVYNTTDQMFELANELAKKNWLAKKGDGIVITCGNPQDVDMGSTNLIKIDEVK